MANYNYWWSFAVLTKKCICPLFFLMFLHIPAVETGHFTFYFWIFVMNEKIKGVRIREQKIKFLQLG